MGLLVYLLLFYSRVCIIIYAHDFLAEHNTLIRASMEGREDRRRTERTVCTQHGNNTGLQAV